MAHLTENMSDEEMVRRLEHKYAHRRIGRALFIKRAPTPPPLALGGPRLSPAQRYTAGRKTPRSI